MCGLWLWVGPSFAIGVCDGLMLETRPFGPGWFLALVVERELADTSSVTRVVSRTSSVASSAIASFGTCSLGHTMGDELKALLSM